MPCVAEAEVTAAEVEQADEHGDEHALLVVLGQLGIHACGYLCRRHQLLGQGVEQARGLRHEERGGHALAADVADGEVQEI